MLIFEWGTTWPFYMPTLMPDAKDLPYMKDMGRVVRVIQHFEISLHNSYLQTYIDAYSPDNYDGLSCFSGPEI